MQTTQMVNASTDREFLTKLVIFLLWPFGAFLFSLRNAGSKSSYMIYFLFGILFCWHLNPTGLGQYDDLTGIMERFINANYTDGYVWDQIVHFFCFDGESDKELYEVVLMWFTKQFTQNPHVFFALASIPYLFFSLKSLKGITSDPKFDNSIPCLIILLLFVLPRDIISVQNPRYATAVWIAVFATLRFFSASKYRYWYIMLILITPIIHSAFWFYVIIFIAGLFVARFTRITFLAYCISIPVSFWAYDVVSTIDISSLPIPENLRHWASFHFNDEAFDTEILQKGGSGFYWVGITFNFIRKIAYILIAVILWKHREEICQRTDGTKQLFSFSLLYFAVVNFIQAVPVLGMRAYFITRILSIYLWFKVIYPRHNNILLFVLFCCSWEIFQRYFYNGAVYTSVPSNIFYSTFPQLIMDFWNTTSMDVLQIF